MSDFPSDITDAARGVLSALLTLGIEIPPADHPKAVAIIAESLAAERISLQADVVAAVATESLSCRERVFAALRMGQRQ